MKYKRHSKLLELVSKNEIETQEELTDLLVKEGFNVTQATVSRDIKELKLIKVLSPNGKYKYASNFAEDETVQGTKFHSIMTETIVKVNVAKNLIVVKTYSGMAQAAAAAIDALDFDGVVGTIAGDDTILIVAEDDVPAEGAADKIRKIIK